MNKRLIAYLISKLCFACGLTLLIPLLLSIVWQEGGTLSFALTVAVAGVIGGGLRYYGALDPDDIITYREGAAVVTFAWVVIAFISALPYMFIAHLPFSSALFESVSCFTTTGISAIEDFLSLPRALLIWRSLTFWLGGIGIVIWVLAMIPNMGTGSVNVFNAEGSPYVRMVPRIGETSSILCRIYVLATGVCMVALYLAGMDAFDSFNHALCVIPAGGYTYYPEGIEHFNNPLIDAVLSFFMLFAGCNFGLYFYLVTGRQSLFWQDTELKVYLGIALGAIALVTADLVLHTPLGLAESLRYGLFQVASCISTTGFVSTDVNIWPAFSEYVCVFLVFLGGCTGSTAGGLKVYRFVVLLKALGQELAQILSPKSVGDITFSGKKMPRLAVLAAGKFFFWHIGLILTFALLLSLSGVDIKAAAGMSLIAMSGLGSALKITGSLITFNDFSVWGQLLLCLEMLLGRLELYAILVLLCPEFWRGTRRW